MNTILMPTLGELEVEFERAVGNWRTVEFSTDDALNAATADLFGLCAAIEQLPAQTATHVRLKAGAGDAP